METIIEGFQNVLRQIAEWGPRILIGLLLLAAGWILAKLVQKAISALARKMGLDKPFESVAEEEATKIPESRRPSAVAGLVSFWLIMLFVLVGFFSAMNLEMVAEPLSAILNKVGTGIPNFLGAIVLLLVGWLVATLLKGLVIKGLNKLDVDNRLNKAGLLKEEIASKKRVSFIAGLFTYGLILLLFAQSALELVGLQLVATTLQDLVNSAVGLIPSLLGAAVVLLVAYLIASLAKPFVKGILESVGINKYGPHFGLAETEEEDKEKKTLSGVLSHLSFWIILLFAFPAVLDQLQLTPIVEPLREVWTKIFGALPNVAAAALIVLATYFLIRIFAPILKGIFEGLGVDTLLGKLGLVNLQQTVESDKVKLSPSEILTRTIIVVVALVMTQEVLNVVGMTYLAQMVQNIVNYIPSVLIAVVILGVAIKLSSVVSDLIEGAASGLEGNAAKTLGLISRVAVILFGGTMAISQLGIGGQLLESSVLILVAGISLAVAISVGLGAKTYVEKLLEAKLPAPKSLPAPSKED